MQVTAISKDEIYQITLPDKVKGQYYLYSTKDNHKEKIASIEGINEKWILKSLQDLRIKSSRDNKLYKKAELSVLNIFTLVNKSNTIFIFTEPITSDRQSFKKYVFEGNIEISIGRDSNNDICFNNKVVSGQHAILKYTNSQWYIRDCDSTNGTFVNNKRVTSTKLKIGDIIFIMGLKIVVSKNLISLNNPDGKVLVSKKLFEFVAQDKPKNETEVNKQYNKDFFYRSPRFFRNIETAKIDIDSPPASPISEERPIFLILGASMTMGMMSLVTLISALATFNVMSMAMGGSMLLGTVLFPIITKNYEKKSKIKKEELRQKKYREYLKKKSVEINEIVSLQEDILKENIVSANDCEDRILNKKRNLWERSKEQDDFLEVRIGKGSIPADIDISYSEPKFAIEDDGLQEELNLVCQSEYKLKSVPISYSLFDSNVSGVIANDQDLVTQANNIIFQLAAFYSYDEVKFCFILNEKIEKQLNYVKWLPHVWDDNKTIRFIASDHEGIKELSYYFDSLIADRISSQNSEKNINMVHYVFFVFDKDLSLRAEFLKKILTYHQSQISASVISFYSSLQHLPKECSMVCEIKDNVGRLFDKNDNKGEFIKYELDSPIINNPKKLCCSLLNTELDISDSKYSLPSMITFLQLFGVGKVEHLNSQVRWKESNPINSLTAPVGYDTYGEIFNLDLHERYHGPHGLIAGMTGSGKSEFIITFILSLAVNYHPNEVAFILIDYKGGGMAKSFSSLPHTVGLITNLDGSSINRCLVSIESELKRRQAIFAEACKIAGESNIDIYKYQEMYRNHIVKEPLPHLFMISDEFAELKTQQPEFMDQLISTARIGRSLGVHLILATQKPSGVVNDQIWSNSRFRVCLKVQEKADSNDMLKRPDAAELTDTGRFYLQVGYNEIFELGQSAWSGAPYFPSDRVEESVDNSVMVVNKFGMKIKVAKYDNRPTMFSNPKKQVDVIVSYLQDVSKEEDVVIRPLWLEPIPEIILHNSIVDKYAYTAEKFVLNPVVGEYDDPSSQRQCLMTVPISKSGNAIVYGSTGSGKTTFLNTLLFSLIQNHNAEELNIFLLDFASETLKMFKKAPQVSDVCISSDAEKIHNLVKLLYKELTERKKKLSNFAGDFISYNKSAEEVIPSVVVVINNYSSFSELYEEEDMALLSLTRDGIRYGIYFIVTATNTNSVRFRMLQNFKQTFCLQLNDETDYSVVMGRTGGLVPAKYKGRGLVKYDKLYEFQTSIVCDDSKIFEYISSYCNKLKMDYKGNTANAIPVLPDLIDLNLISKYVANKSDLEMPIGMQTDTLKIVKYNFKKQYINAIVSQGVDYKYFFNDVAESFDKLKLMKTYLLDTDSALNNFNQLIYCDNSNMSNAIDELFEIAVQRNNSYKDAKKNNNAILKFETLLIIINNVDSVFNHLDAEHKEKLSLVLEKGEIEYNMHVIIGSSLQNFSMYSSEVWYRNKFKDDNCIWVGSGINQQYFIKVNSSSRDLRSNMTPEYGFLIDNGTPSKIKLIGSTYTKEKGQ